jgi:hypothetical protein
MVMALTVSDTGVIVIPTSVGAFKNDRFLTVDCKPYVKNLMARRANEKPLHGTISFLEHTMEAVLVTAFGTDFKFFTSVHLMYLVIHLINLQMSAFRCQNMPPNTSISHDPPQCDHSAGLLPVKHR